MKRAATLLPGLVVMLVGCPGVKDVLTHYGYTELRPPSTLLAPGTLVWVQGRHPYSAGIVCTQAASLGDGFVPLQAPTATSELLESVRNDIVLGAQYADMVRTDNRFAAVNGISVALENPLIYTLSDADVIRNVDKRDPLCTQAIAARHRAGFDVTMIVSALMADVTYHVTLKDEAHLDAQTKRNFLSALAPHLGIEAARVGESTISGTGLFWGVADDAHLATLGAYDEPRSTMTTGLRLLPADTLFSPEGDPDVW